MRRFAPLLLLALGGCLGDDIRPAEVPPVQPPPAWRTDAAAAAPFDATWWQSFGDPALTALVERALANNSDIAIAVGRIREARGNLQAVAAQRLPTLDAGASAGHSRSVSAFGTPLVQDFAQPQLQVGYEIDLFGRLADQKSAARDAFLASEAGRDAVRLSIANTVAGSYIALIGLDARLEVARATLEARSDSLRIARSRVDRGYSPRLELDQAEAEYQSAVQIVPQAELAITRLEDSLSLLTGDTPHAIARGGKLDTINGVTVPAGLPSELLRRRPDIAQAEYQLAAADKSLAVARKRFLPQLRLSAAGGAAFSTLLADPITIWSVGGSILAPLFQGGRLTGQAEAAAGQRDQAAFAYRRAALGAFREVEDALAAVKRLDEQVAAASAQRDALGNALRRATNRYHEGYSPYLEQLDAQRQFLASQLGLVQARTDALNARVQLYAALGGGWSAEGVPRP
jgi:NodT family efflux transporter outer membrane factor (OMF) lipoprotein